MKAIRNLTGGQKKTLMRILISGILLAVFSILRMTEAFPDKLYIWLPLYAIPYLLIGWDVLWKAIRNVANGQLLDENFLMSIATVGAFCIAEYPEAVFVMLFYQVGELFQSIAVGKSRKSIAALMEIRPDEARVERDGKEIVVDPEEVEVGEILVVRPGEKIALDGVVEQGASELNTLSLTGETALREVEAGDTVYSGSVNVSGLLRLRVSKPFGESTVSKILELVENSSMVKSRAENAITKFAHWYTPAIVVGALLLAIVPSVITGDWTRWLRSAFIFLVVSCPCALVISVPLSYFGGLGSASRHGILVKGANRLEALADADIVVFDKTGTLTEGHFSVTSVSPVGMSEEELLVLAAAAEQNSNHPIAQSLRQAAEHLKLPELSEVEELPGYGVRGMINGQCVLAGNARLMRQESVGDFPDEKSTGTTVYVALDGVFAGSVFLSDAIKKTSAEAVSGLRACGVRKVVMLTGDHAETAASVASELQLDAHFAELLPQDKVECMKKLADEKQGSVLFSGDGVNDAPVLAGADVGIAMGALGSDAAIEAADVVIMDDNPVKISLAIRLARFTRRIVYENIVFALVVKAFFLVLSIFNLTGMWAASFADVGVAVLAILNAMRTLRFRG